MSVERSPAVNWRATIEGSRTLRGKQEVVTFDNPGDELIVYFRGRFFRHEPIHNEEGKVIGHNIEISLVPHPYDFQLRRRQFAQAGLK